MMINTLRIMDVIQRSLRGPIVDEEQFDREHVTLGLRQVVKQYGIRLDRSHVVNLDNELADRVWEAALDFLASSGIYCLDTGRIIQFNRAEIEHILSEAPQEVILGAGDDAVHEKYRTIGETRPPLNMGGPVGTPISEGLFIPVMLSYVQEPGVDVVCPGTLSTTNGSDIRTRSPLEIMAAWQECDQMMHVLQKANRPGMAINCVQISISDVGFLSAISRGGYRPTDMHTLGMISELKINFEQLNKVAHVIYQNGIIDPFANPIYGGLGGGSEGIAVLLTAEMVALNLAFMAVCHGSSPTHPFNFNDTSREIMQATSLALQALARNSHLMTNMTVSPVGGPGTKTLLYECAAFTTLCTASGISRILGPRSACGTVQDHVSGLEARFNGKVAQAAAQLNREQADEIVKQALENYEDLQDKKPFGRPFQEVYERDTIQPTSEWLAIYDDVLEQVSNWGLPVK
ncbi:MAG: monomethylamine:corrinoid methyltransferase [Anaerolineae bacterium]|nr:monomethylamine:corrinoid methyltransferase [Anaerolineae bacterium]